MPSVATQTLSSKQRRSMYYYQDNRERILQGHYNKYHTDSEYRLNILRDNLINYYERRISLLENRLL